MSRTRTLEAAATSFCRLLHNWRKAFFIQRSLKADLAVPFGPGSGLKEYLNELELVGIDKKT